MDLPGFEPGALRMRSECDTTTPQTQVKSLAHVFPHDPSLAFQVPSVFRYLPN